MKQKVIAGLLLLSLLLGGCGRVFEGKHVFVKPHEQQTENKETEDVSAESYDQLYSALTDLIDNGKQTGVILVQNYEHDQIEPDMRRAVGNICAQYPLAAYAVDRIQFELGRSGGLPALAVALEYTHDRSEILKIKQVPGMEEAQKAITGALNRCDVSIVLQVRDYRAADLVQMVESYAMNHPESVMELPEVTVNLYPESGRERIVELKFAYQTNRDSLRNMQKQVEPIFNSAALYVTGDAADREKYGQLYSFLMERYDYEIRTSITPTYSLLRHGVGDSRAFAMVYGAMCRRAGLTCLMVSGTRAGERCYWNIILDENVYYHVDLLSGSFSERTDAEMTDYVWDYSAYPACGVPLTKDTGEGEKEN